VVGRLRTGPQDFPVVVVVAHQDAGLAGQTQFCQVAPELQDKEMLVVLLPNLVKQVAEVVEQVQQVWVDQGPAMAVMV
jgi:hypothetical protein